MKLVFLGLSITSAWGNGHATTYRGLLRELTARGHEVLFLERDVPWYAANRDLPEPPYCRTLLYTSLDELRDCHTRDVQTADGVIVGSYVPDGVAVGEWVTTTARGLSAFYDIDTPITLAKLRRGDHEYLSPALIPRYSLYLSFTGGPMLQQLEHEYGAQAVRALYCAVDPMVYRPEEGAEVRYDLGYMGTYSADRQPTLERLLIRAAQRWTVGRFAVAGPQYPVDIPWPSNVERMEHLAPAEHRAFYNAARFTLNVTRADMIRAGWSPSIRLFEAAACGVPIISDEWPGLSDFFRIGTEILIAQDTTQMLLYLRDLSDDARHAIGERARTRVLAEHTAAHRAAQLESYLRERLA